MRLAELAWSAETGLPRLEADAPGRWMLYVCGKGRKARAIPQPTPCVAAIRAYLHARSLAAEPPAHEALPVIHGNIGKSRRSLSPSPIACKNPSRRRRSYCVRRRRTGCATPMRAR
uniref:hypothetical protein n=1 Tax=Cupriavidus necator TaxID=106590 RepID=UPI003F49825D